MSVRRERNKREIESGRFLRELLNLPTTPIKRAYVAQYNPNHYILFSGSPSDEEVSHGLSQ